METMKHSVRLNCPKCMSEILVSLTYPDKVAENPSKAAIDRLRIVWDKQNRGFLTDEQNLVWLDSQKMLLLDMGFNKYEALKMLKKDKAKDEDADMGSQCEADRAAEAQAEYDAQKAAEAEDAGK